MTRVALRARRIQREMIELVLAIQTIPDQAAPVWHAWYTFAILLLVCVGLAGSLAPPDMILLAGMLGVGLAGIVSVEEMVAGFANPAVLTVGALFVVAAAVRETGAMDTVGGRILGRARTERAALLRIAAPVVGMSAFLNNTPVVAMMIGILSDWCRKHGVSPSRLLMPLSYLAILGGTCTLIGASTNLLINGMMTESTIGGEHDPRLDSMGLFEMAWVGVPFVVVGVLYLLTVGRRLLPDRKELIEQLGDSAREYLVNMVVQPGCRLIGQTVEAAGLRRLPGLFLIEIDREGQLIAPVGPDVQLAERDRLTFTGVVSTIVDLERIPGLVPEPEQKFGGDSAHRRNRRLCEAVVSGTSPLIGNNIRDADFRARYNAVVVAVHRGGARLKGRIGDIVIKPGDTLLLQTGPHFARANRNSPDFYLVSTLEEVRAVRHERAAISLALLGVMIVLLIVSQSVPTVLSALLVAGLMIAFRCISATEARRSVDWQVLLTMAAALALGKAMHNSGAAAAAAGFMVDTAGAHPKVLLSVIILLTAALASLITNKAAAAVMFPLAIGAAYQMDVDPRPFAMAIVFAAALVFPSPVGYQTNMMIYGPGGYRFADFVRVGLPLNVLLWLVATALIPIVWPF